MLPGMDLFLLISPEGNNTFWLKDRVLSFKDGFSLHLWSLSAFGMHWYVSAGKIFIPMCRGKKDKGKDFFSPLRDSEKWQDRGRYFFLKGTVVCMKTLIVTRTSMELQEKVDR